MRDTRVKVEKGSPFFSPHQLDSNRLVSGKERGWSRSASGESDDGNFLQGGKVGDHERRDVAVLEEVSSVILVYDPV